MGFGWLTVLWMGLTAPAGAPGAATAELRDFQQRCASAGRALWGQPLCAPVVIVNTKTGKFRTSARPPDAPLPTLRGNTAIKWGGENWVMVLEPLPSDRHRLSALLFHEAWHAKQEGLGFPGNNVVAGHLDEAPARYQLRLEWAALADALKSTGGARRRHIAQALAFRQRRLGGDEKARAAERDHMRVEGLAAYTGTALSGAPTKLALEELSNGHRKPSLSRSFGYVSGPAWGLLLDSVVPGWRKRLSEGVDLPDLMTVRPASIVRADDYGGTGLLAEETSAGVQRAAVLREALESTAPHRALRLPLAKMNMSFDPNSVLAAPDGGPIYRTMTLSDRWGEISVSGSVLRISPDYRTAFVPWPLRASDRLTLAPGWKVEQSASGGGALVGPES